MNNPSLFRKRLIPEECIPLKDDQILLCNDTCIVTSWMALHPKKDLHHGYSCYFLKEGYKVSKFYKHDGSLLYWYCDIVNYNYNAEQNSLLVTDLLADVIIYPDGFVKVVDLDELVEALNENKITNEELKESLLKLNRLLEIIYQGKFHELTGQIDSVIED